MESIVLTRLLRKVVFRFCRNKNGGQRNIDIIRNAYFDNE